jgi:hypothetical protein
MVSSQRGLDLQGVCSDLRGRNKGVPLHRDWRVRRRGSIDPGISLSIPDRFERSIAWLEALKILYITAS